jgi:transcriptional regulator of aromatic amino acid metabolism
MRSVSCRWGLQAKLLTFIETKKFRRLGSTVEKHVDSSPGDRHQSQSGGLDFRSKFRQDLFYRLNVVRLVVPPLRQLGEDVLLLARHFICHYNSSLTHRSRISMNRRANFWAQFMAGKCARTAQHHRKSDDFCSNRVLTAKDLNRMQSDQEAGTPAAF